MPQEQLKIFIENDAVESGIFVGFFLEEEGSAALDNKGKQVGLENGFICDKVGDPQVVDEEDVADDQEIEVRSVGGEEDYGRLAVSLDFPYFLQHLHVDGDLLE